MSEEALSIVVIDDERTFDPGPLEENHILYLRTSDKAMAFLSKLWIDQYNWNVPNLYQLWLDHDLGGSDTIMPVIRFLNLIAFIGYPLGVNEIKAHTMNPVGGFQMVQELSAYNVQRVPLPSLIGVKCHGND